MRKRMLALCLLLILVWPVNAQDPTDTPRNPWGLARRLRHFSAEYALPPVTPLYDIGDEATFWVAKTGSSAPQQITATLTGATDRVYLWVENGLDYNAQAMPQAAQAIHRSFVVLRLKEVYGQPTYIPDFGVISDTSSLLPITDIDADPHLYILYSSDLDGPIVQASTNDTLPQQIAPSGISNQHELLIVNRSIFPNAPLEHSAITSVITSGLYQYLAQQHVPQQSLWLQEAFATLLTRLLDMPEVIPDSLEAYFQAPETALQLPVSYTGQTATYGAQQLFMDYVFQFYGLDLIQAAFSQSEPGLHPFDHVLAQADILNPTTGTHMTGADLFADFIAANVMTPLLEAPFGDNRFYNRMMPENTAPPLGNYLDIVADEPLRFNHQTVNQWGTRYYYLTTQAAQSIEVRFTGEATAPRLPLPTDTPTDNTFYWSGNTPDRNPMLTRAFDLRTLTQATLEFDTWYALATARNYAYVSVSTDGGTHWDLLSSAQATSDNRYALAYGPGYTGNSNQQSARPYPFLGVVFADDALTVTEIVDDGPSENVLAVGDHLIGYDARPWAEGENIFTVLDKYEANQEIDLYIERDNVLQSVRVVLGEHPTRQHIPSAVWIRQSADLSAYAGQEILLRFEYVSQPTALDSGIALDNITLAALDYYDDASTPTDWTLNGFRQVQNSVPQPWLVQYMTTGSTTSGTPPRVRRIIGPGESTQQTRWRFMLQPDEVAVIAISGLSEDTHQPASFALEIVPITAE